jgi:hypothetical protein
MYWLKILLYGSDFMYLKLYDTVLSWFKNTDYLPNEAVYKNAHPKTDDFLQKLTQDSYLTSHIHGIEITLKDKQQVAKGGYLAQAFRKRLIVFFTLISSLVAIIAFFYSFF